MAVINAVTNIFYFSDSEDGGDTWPPQEATLRRVHGWLGLARVKPG